MRRAISTAPEGPSTRSAPPGRHAPGPRPELGGPERLRPPLAYLGLTPQHLLNTYLRWVALLADPWVRFPPHTEAYAALMSGYERLAEGAIEHEPRRMAGRRLVTRRESWLMSAPTLLDAARDGDGLSVRRIDELRRRHHLPPRVFVQQLAKYGGPEGMEDAEILFQKSSQACADNRVWTWSPLERLMAAIDYIGAVEREGGFEPGALSARIADRWADRLRYGGLDPDKVRRRSPTLNERVRARARPPADWTELVLLTSGVLAARAASAAPEFPLDLVHMHINRLGLNPLEECLAAHLCAPSPTTTQGGTHHDRPEPRS